MKNLSGSNQQSNKIDAKDLLNAVVALICSCAALIPVFTGKMSEWPWLQYALPIFIIAIITTFLCRKIIFKWIQTTIQKRRISRIKKVVFNDLREHFEEAERMVGHNSEFSFISIYQRNMNNSNLGSINEWNRIGGTAYALYDWHCSIKEQFDIRYTSSTTLSIYNQIKKFQDHLRHYIIEAVISAVNSCPGKENVTEDTKDNLQALRGFYDRWEVNYYVLEKRIAGLLKDKNYYHQSRTLKQLKI